MTASESSRPPNGRLLLVVDDEPSIREAIALVVAEDFARIWQAADGVEALELATRERPALVVLDLTMPRMGGVETCSRLRALPDWQDVPIIVLTAERADARLRAAYAAGANDYLFKPFTIGQLRARLRTLELRRSR